jgi:hypothetical protein
LCEESFERNSELATILLPAGKKGMLANWFAPDNEGKKFLIFTLNKCSIFGSQSIEIKGTTAAWISTENKEQVVQTLVWNEKEEIKEIELQSGLKFTPELTNKEGKVVTFNGEIEVELVTKENWGAF